MIKCISRSNSETGKIEESIEVVSFKRAPRRRFIKLYVDRMDLLTSLGKTDLLLMLELSRNADFQSNEVRLTKLFKKRMADHLGKNERTLTNCICNLVKSGFLRRMGTGHFLINPLFSCTGSVAAQEKLINKWQNHLAE